MRKFIAAIVIASTVFLTGCSFPGITVETSCKVTETQNANGVSTTTTRSC